MNYDAKCENKATRSEFNGPPDTICHFGDGFHRQMTEGMPKSSEV